MNNKISALILIMLIGMIGISQFAFADEIVIEDYDGVSSTIEKPVETIVCLSTSANQIIMALGAFDRVIAWDNSSSENMFPYPDKELKVVGNNSHSPKIEAIAELNPDVLIADTMLQDDHRKMIQAFNIPVVVERTSDPERLYTTIRNVARVVSKEERAEKLITFIKKYRGLISERLGKLSEEEKKKVYWEWYKPFKTSSKTGSVGPKIEAAGGINICADTEGRYPTVSSEFVWESNPEVIVKQAGRGASLEEMKEAYNNVITRESLKSTTAVKEGNVHVITWDVFSGLTSIIGDLYFAKWLHPELFEDIKPDKVYGELLNNFYGVIEHSARAYSK